MPKSPRTTPGAPSAEKAAKAGARLREALTRDRIEEAALTLVAAEGLEGFSLRKLADVLGCQAMSLYHHFPSKAHLLDALVDRLVGGLAWPSPEQAPVQRLVALAEAWRGLARAHPRFFPFLAMHRLNSAVGVAFLEEVMRALQQAGFPPETAARLFRAVNYYLVGAGLDEVAGYANGPGSMEPVGDAELAEKFPLIAAAGRYFTPVEFDRTFEFGLQRLLQMEPSGRGRG